MFSSAVEILQMVYEQEIISQLLDELMEINELDVSRGGLEELHQEFWRTVEILQIVYGDQIISQLLGIPCNFCVSYIWAKFFYNGN